MYPHRILNLRSSLPFMEERFQGSTQDFWESEPRTSDHISHTVVQEPQPHRLLY
jgi:hypothetical protein